MRSNLVLLLPCLLQMLVSTRFGLGVDEAHYMLYGRYLDWSYFDHPPLVGWTHAAFNFFLGETEFSARLPAIFIGYFTSLSLFRVLKARDVRPNVALFATLATMTLSQIFILNLFLLPETFLLLTAVILVRLCDRVEHERIFSLRSGFFFGLTLAIAALSKFTAILFVIPLAIFLISHFGFHIFTRPGFWLMILTASLGVWPVVAWNAAHDWISFRFQAAHVLSGNEHLKSFFQSWALQLALVSPWFWLASLIGFFAILKSKKRETFLRALLAVFAVFFIYASFQSAVLSHWTAVFYELAVPFGICALNARWSKTLRGFFIFQVGLLSFAVVLFLSGVIARIPDGLREITGWPEIMENARSELRTHPGAGLAVANWTYGSRALFYGGRGADKPLPKADFFVLDDRMDQFHLWNPVRPIGRDVLILSFSYDELDRARYKCGGGWGENIRLPISAGNSSNAPIVYTAILSWCRGLTQ